MKDSVVFEVELKSNFTSCYNQELLKKRVYHQKIKYKVFVIRKPRGKKAPCEYNGPLFAFKITTFLIFTLKINQKADLVATLRHIAYGGKIIVTPF